MSRHPAVWSDPKAHLQATLPDHPVLYFSPARLRATAHQFLSGFPGLVTYAVKANDAAVVLENLVASGIRAFDVASPEEMEKVRAAAPGAAMHYNNPVRSKAEVAAAVRFGVRSFSVDSVGELAKLIAAVPAEGTEVSVRLKLPVPGAAYDFGTKFGAGPDDAVDLLRRVADAGFTPSMTFHPGTQCERAEAWTQYIDACAQVAKRANVSLKRLNVGGGFPSHRVGKAPDLQAIFQTIGRATARAFDTPPELVCEPGRAMVAEAFILAARVKCRRDAVIFLNDGIYGGLAETAFMGAIDRITVVPPLGTPRSGESFDATVFGPTCDSLDRMKGTVALPETIIEDDYLIIEGMGGYSTATVTRFNGYGAFETVTIGPKG